DQMLDGQLEAGGTEAESDVGVQQRPIAVRPWRIRPYDGCDGGCQQQRRCAFLGGPDRLGVAVQACRQQPDDTRRGLAGHPSSGSASPVSSGSSGASVSSGGATEWAASISIHPDNCTDMSRSGISDALTAPSTSSACLPPATGISAWRSQKALNRGRSSTVCR